MNRRTLLRAAVFVPAVGLLACTTQTTTQVANDINLIASGLAAVIAGINKIPAVPNAALTQLDSYLATIQADAKQIAGTLAAPTTSMVQQIAQVVQAVASIVLPLVPGGSAIEVTVQAALSLLPVVMAEVGVSGVEMSTKFSPNQARLILAAAH